MPKALKRGFTKKKSFKHVNKRSFSSCACTYDAIATGKFSQIQSHEIQRPNKEAVPSATIKIKGRVRQENAIKSLN